MSWGAGNFENSGYLLFSARENKKFAGRKEAGAMVEEALFIFMSVVLKQEATLFIARNTVMFLKVWGKSHQTCTVVNDLYSATAWHYTNLAITY